MSHKFKITKVELAAILYEVDPMGLNFAPEDEYESEVEMILNDLGDCNSLEDIYALLIKVFIEMFDKSVAQGEASNRLFEAAKILYDKKITV